MSITTKIFRELSRYRPRAIKDRLRLAFIDATYDATHNVGTGGVRRLRALTVDSPNRKYGVDFRAVYPHEFYAGMDALPIKNFSGFTFVDLGSGKGRALLLARRYRFKRYVGVEFAKELNHYAACNTQEFDDVELRCMDATEYVFPEGPLVVFLYNPFGHEVMLKVARNTPRRAWVVYVNPFFTEPWFESGFDIQSSGSNHVILQGELS
jgi:SAM-dependent methyltransferase